MKIYHSKSEIDKMPVSEVERLHKNYIGVLMAILIIGAGVSMLAIWDYLPEIWSYLLLLFILILWPWVMRSSQMARKLKEEENNK